MLESIQAFVAVGQSVLIRTYNLLMAMVNQKVVQVYPIVVVKIGTSTMMVEHTITGTSSTVFAEAAGTISDGLEELAVYTI